MGKKRTPGESLMGAREGALKILYAVEVEGAYANLVLDRLLRGALFSKLERAFLTELVYGTLRWQNKIDWMLSQVLRPNLEQLTPWIRNILRLGIYQLFFMQKIPASAVCNEGTNLARRYGHRGVAGLVNGVLRNAARRKEAWSFPKFDVDPVAHIAVCYSHPAWMVERWIKRYGIKATKALCLANNQPADNWIRTNTLRLGRAELAQHLQAEGVEVEPSNLVPEGLNLKRISAFTKLPGFSEGWFQIQDESSMLAAHALKPWPGARIIDACAAPGGKTTHIAQLMENQGEIIALDQHAHKIGLIKENCRRLAINVVQTFSRDARDLPEPWFGWADGVLVDAPCSGLGVLRRRPDARWRKQPVQIKELAALQLEILLAASQCVRPGGVLLYSTCTLEPEENEQLIEKFLKTWAKQYPEKAGFQRAELGSLLSDALNRPADQEQMARGHLTLFPHIHGTDGFFLTRLQRKG